MLPPKLNCLNAVGRLGDDNHVRLQANHRSQSRQDRGMVIRDQHADLVCARNVPLVTWPRGGRAQDRFCSSGWAIHNLAASLDDASGRTTEIVVPAPFELWIDNWPPMSSALSAIPRKPK